MRKKSWLTVICCLLLVCLLPSLAMAKNKTKAPARDWKLTVAQQSWSFWGMMLTARMGVSARIQPKPLKNSRRNMG